MKHDKQLDKEFKKLTLIENYKAFDAVVELAKRHQLSITDCFFKLSHLNQLLAIESL